jgi:Asp-tRNA(Asn)/Glu-tRNA(Gln) amidotransferase A subunit family amidase
MGPKVYETRNGLSAIHAVTRSVRDSAALLDLSQGRELGDAYASPAMERPYSEEIGLSPGALRIALMTQPLLPIPVAPECVAAAEDAANLCESMGHRVELASPKLDVMQLWGALGVSSNVLVAEKIRAREAVLGRPVKPEELERITWKALQDGRKVSAVEYSAARKTLHRASRSLASFMQDYDAILSPSMGLLPPKLGALSLNQEYESFMHVAAAASAFSALQNMTGQPAMSLPLYWTEAEIPVGSMFAGRLRDEATLFRLAAQLERARPWFQRVPAL